MHNPEDYAVCMALESAEKRIYNRLADIREEIESDWSAIRDGIRIVTRYNVAELNDSIRRSALELDIIL